MPSTGYTLAGAGANNADFGNVAWTNPGNIVSDNASYASALNVVDGGTTQYLHATNFSFAVPTGALIAGIQFRVERYFTQDVPIFTTRDHSIQLIIAGTRTGTIKTISGPWTETTPTVQDAGGATDLWGCSLTPAIVNASDFGVALRAKHFFATGQGDFFVDYIQLNITYGLGRSQVRVIV